MPETTQSGVHDTGIEHSGGEVSRKRFVKVWHIFVSLYDPLAESLVCFFLDCVWYVLVLIRMVLRLQNAQDYDMPDIPSRVPERAVRPDTNEASVCLYFSLLFHRHFNGTCCHLCVMSALRLQMHPQPALCEHGTSDEQLYIFTSLHEWGRIHRFPTLPKCRHGNAK